MARVTREVVILFTDIEGSTKLWESHPEEMATALMRHDTIVRHAIESHKGRVFKTVGDAFCATFDSVRTAMAACIAAQVGLESQEWDVDVAIHVRMAIHAGEAEERGNDFFGNTVNKVARLLSTGFGGQILVSGVAVHLLDTTPDQSNLISLGKHRLKDLHEPEEIFQVQHPQLRRDFPPLKSIHGENTNLPVQLTSFIGREQELARVKSNLREGRLSTLTGPGGCGKSRLSIQAAADMAEDFPDGIWMAELAELSEGSSIDGNVALALSIRETPDGSLRRDIIENCRNRKLLLILDNCEHVIENAAKFAKDILQQCSDVKILATSREPLGMPGESIYQVPSLASLDPEQLESNGQELVDYLNENDAARLFIERATAVSANFSVGEQNALSVAQVCYQLDGIPLAIELAAARVKVLPIEQIATRLDDRFRLLTAGSRTHLPRQQTLRALIDWSYDLLEENEKALLRRLSVFAGGWTLESAEPICEGADVEAWEVLDLTSKLVDKSLVTVDSNPNDVRYGLLQTVRQYSREKLIESSEDIEYQQRHMAHFAELAREGSDKLQGSEQAEWLNRFEKDRANLRAALDHALLADTQTAVAMAAHLWRYWMTHSIFTEGRIILTNTLQLPDIDRSQVEYAKALQGAGVLAMTQMDNEVAKGYLQECLNISREYQHAEFESAALNSLGNLAWKQGAYEQSRELYEASLTLEKSRGNDTGVARATISLGNVATQRAEYEDAERLYTEALTMSRRLKNSAWEAAILHNLGDVAWLQGHNEEAGEHYQASYEVREVLGDRLGMARATNKLGDVAMARGDRKKARELFNQTLRETRKLRDHLWEAGSLADLGDLDFIEGHVDEALELHKQALTMRRDLDDQYGIAHSLTMIGNIFAAQGNAADASWLYGAAETLRKRIGAPLPPVERADFDRGRERAVASLGESEFERVYSEGAAVEFTDAVERALRG